MLNHFLKFHCGTVLDQKQASFFVYMNQISF